jgi:hypothetical protein
MVMMVRMERGDAGALARLAQDLLFRPFLALPDKCLVGQSLGCLGTLDRDLFGALDDVDRG